MNVQGFEPKPKKKDCEVWPEHLNAVKIFLLCDKQWRTSGEAVLGIDLLAVMQVAPLYTEVTASLIEEIRVISDRAAELINSGRAG